MPRFFFHVISPRGNLIDLEGVDVPTLEAECASDFVRDVLCENADMACDPDDEVRVVDDLGCTVVSVKLSTHLRPLEYPSFA